LAFIREMSGGFGLPQPLESGGSGAGVGAGEASGVGVGVGLGVGLGVGVAAGVGVVFGLLRGMAGIVTVNTPELGCSVGCVGSSSVMV
jgi:hypothetical protein